MTLISAAAWLVVPIAWQTSSVLERTRPWEGSPRAAYLIGAVAALVAGSLMLFSVLQATAAMPRPKLTWLGIGLLALGLAVSLVAGWAFPAWATLYGVGMLLISVGGRFNPSGRIIGTALLASTAAFVVMSELEVGTVDSYGDYPVAWAVATWVGTLGAAVGMLIWARPDAGTPAPELERSSLN